MAVVIVVVVAGTPPPNFLVLDHAKKAFCPQPLSPLGKNYMILKKFLGFTLCIASEDVGGVDENLRRLAEEVP